VKLNVRRGIKGQASLFVNFADQVCLRFGAGHSDTGRLTIYIRAYTTDHGTDSVTVSDGIAKALYYESANALTSAIAVCSVIEGV
jgi:hypothetical protein